MKKFYPLLILAIITVLVGGLLVLFCVQKVSKVAEDEYREGVGGRELPVSVPISYLLVEDGENEIEKIIDVKERSKANLLAKRQKDEILKKEGKLKIEKRKDLDELIGGDWYYYENTMYPEMGEEALKKDRQEAHSQYRKNSSRPDFHAEYVGTFRGSEGKPDEIPLAYWFEDKKEGWIVEFTAYIPLYTIKERDVLNKVVAYTVEKMKNEFKEHFYNVAKLTVSDIRTDYNFEGKRSVDLEFFNKESFKKFGWATERKFAGFYIDTKESGYQIIRFGIT